MNNVQAKELTPDQLVENQTIVELTHSSNKLKFQNHARSHIRHLNQTAPTNTKKLNAQKMNLLLKSTLPFIYSGLLQKILKFSN